MRGRFWRKVIIKRGKNVAYPQTNDSFRATENRPGIKYNPAKKTTLFAEDLKALGDSIISIQNAVGNFNLNEQGSISSRVYALPWDATIGQIGTELKIPALASRAVFIGGIVKLMAFYKAPEMALAKNLYIRSPKPYLSSKIGGYPYFFNSLQFRYKFDRFANPYIGTALAYISPKQRPYIFINYHDPKNTSTFTRENFPVDQMADDFSDRLFIKNTIIRFQMEYLADA